MDGGDLYFGSPCRLRVQDKGDFRPTLYNNSVTYVIQRSLLHQFNDHSLDENFAKIPLILSFLFFFRGFKDLFSFTVILSTVYGWRGLVLRFTVYVYKTKAIFDPNFQNPSTVIEDRILIHEPHICDFCLHGRYVCRLYLCRLCAVLLLLLLWAMLEINLLMNWWLMMKWWWMMMTMASVAIAYSANECTKSSGCIVCAHRESLFIFDRVMGSHVVHCVFFYH